MADHWNDNTWTVYPGSGPGPQIAGATIFRGLRQFCRQRVETSLDTGVLPPIFREKVMQLLESGHALSIDEHRLVANMLLYHVNGGAYDYRVWYVRPNELNAWVGPEARAMADSLRSSMQLLDMGDIADELRCNSSEGTVAIKLSGKAVLREVEDRDGYRTKKKVPQADNRLQHLRGLVMDWIRRDAHEYVRLRREAIRALDNRVRIDFYQSFCGDKV